MNSYYALSVLKEQKKVLDNKIEGMNLLEEEGEQINGATRTKYQEEVASLNSAIKILEKKSPNTMKIVTKDNFDRDLFAEQVVAENVNEFFGRELVNTWNEKYWTNESDIYLELVEDDYKLYDGYAELL